LTKGVASIGSQKFEAVYSSKREYKMSDDDQVKVGTVREDDSLFPPYDATTEIDTTKTNNS
jgi:hypothetical protein